MSATIPENWNQIQLQFLPDSFHEITSELETAIELVDGEMWAMSKRVEEQPVKEQPVEEQLMKETIEDASGKQKEKVLRG
ncbi:hypothetical protein Ptr902_13813 [Pyrenophora tritici-repentis]|uniref:Uncharacterized protein n=1 Tax=Pyrenophora tritici-repentis TaxID=45151 RepID=A0A834RXH5_9PLEO|nr:hypothetical protein PtrM4_091830 [Pyrenophora tritici-repentis]KAI0579729.1 hypothetical protein Alg215_05599 [Pyrenophora tritici-repentis]KAI2474778.1 hypothetical protein Ptr902_13813 [Pyrenophora tritici-repentis]PZD30413.1 hypothetical protein A1F96_04363 [Pyrenophora tritici-repentis]